MGYIIKKHQLIMKTKVIIHENRVKIYFRHEKHFVRYNTKIPALSKNEFYRRNPNNLFYPLSEENEKRNQKIKDLQNFIEEIVEDNLGRFNVVINNQFIKNRLNQTHDNSYQKRYVIEFYADFLKQKEGYYIRHGSAQSIKDYNSMFQSLMDYQIHFNSLLELQDINKDWIKEYLYFLTQKNSHNTDYDSVSPKVVEVLKRNLEYISKRKARFRFTPDYIRYVSKGGIGDNTMNKRIDNLKEFLQFLIKNTVIEDMDFDIKEVRKLYSRYRTVFTTLTLDEVRTLYNLKIEKDYPDKRYEYVKDIFVFMCSTSFRYSDVVTFNKIRDIRNGKINKVLKKTRRYGNRSIIKLQNTTLAILEKYDYKMDKYCNTLFNRYLTEMLEQTGLFCESFVPVKAIGGNGIDMDPIPRYKAIKSHTGRRSCITNLIALGKQPEHIRIMTGQSSNEIMRIYIDYARNDGDDYDGLSDALENSMKITQSKFDWVQKSIP
jgi:site-specific recombinase XerD